MLTIKKQKDRYQISSAHPLFRNKEVVMLLNIDSIKFSKPRFDYNGKTYKPLTQYKNKAERFIYINIEWLPTGKFEIVEENEDILIYFEDGK